MPLRFDWYDSLILINVLKLRVTAKKLREIIHRIHDYIDIASLSNHQSAAAAAIGQIFRANLQRDVLEASVAQISV